MIFLILGREIKMAMEQFNPMKIMYHLDRVNDYLKGKNIYPVTVEIDPSNACNHNCVWCTFDYFRAKDKDVLSREVLLKLMEELAEVGVKSIIWTGGGEPWVNKNLQDAILLAHKKGIDQGMATNGVLLSKDDIEAIVKTHIYCRISLDAGTEETYDKVHNGKKGDFKKIIENMKLFSLIKKETNSKIDLGASLLVHPFNYKDIVKAAELTKECGFNFFQLKPVVMHHGEQLPSSLFEKAVELGEEAKKLTDENFKVFVIDYKFKDIINRENNFGRNYSKCWGHSFIGQVSANGNVYLCCHLRGFPEFCFGNIKEKSFKEIWESKERQEAINRIDFSKCQPLCKLHETNKILDYIKNPHRHKNIL